MKIEILGKKKNEIKMEKEGKLNGNGVASSEWFKKNELGLTKY